MSNHGELTERCLAVLAELSREHRWTLRDEQREAYVRAIVPMLAPEASDAELFKRLLYYHLDHDLVGALVDSAHPGHRASWEAWCVSALRIVRHTGLADSTGPLSSPEDLSQIALEEVLKALPSYAYRSRFTTWAYPVIVRAVQRQCSSHRAAKRSGPTLSLDAALSATDPQASAGDHPEVASSAHLLAELARQVLSESKDTRMALVFQLWAVEDRRLTDIARVVGLDPSRVSVLLKEARKLLQQDPSVRAWLGEPEDDG